MALDAASPGRLAVTFYREQMLEQYLGNLEKWQEDCAWVLPVRASEDNSGRTKKQKRAVFAAYAPLPDTIARVAYGRRIDDSLRKATVERLLPCIVDGAPVPRDIMDPDKDSLRFYFLGANWKNRVEHGYLPTGVAPRAGAWIEAPVCLHWTGNQ